MLPRPSDNPNDNTTTSTGDLPGATPTTVPAKAPWYRSKWVWIVVAVLVIGACVLFATGHAPVTALHNG